MPVTLTCGKCGAVRTVKPNRNKTGLCKPCHEASRTENALPSEERKRRARIKGKARYAADPEKFRAKGKADYWANPERAQARAVAWKAANPKRKQQHTRKFNLSKYGVTPEVYTEMLAAQNGVCAICESAPKAGKNLHVDHCHRSLVVRGLLCNHCNSGLGGFRDKTELLWKASAYLERYRCQ